MSNPITSQQLLDGLRWRYAAKQFDPARKIPADQWAALEEALVLSPSSGGLQPRKFVVVSDPAVRERLLPASFGQTQVVEASHLVVFAASTDVTEADVDAHIAHTARTRGADPASLAGFRQMLVEGIVKGKDHPARQTWAAKQAYIALGNLLTSAALLGIDTCPMEGFLPTEYDAILGLTDQGLTSVVICTLGYRAVSDAYANLRKVRYPKERLILHV